MNKYQWRFLGGLVLVFVPLAFGTYHIGLQLSNKFSGSIDDKGNLNGFIGVLFNVVVAFLLAIPTGYLSLVLVNPLIEKFAPKNDVPSLVKAALQIIESNVKIKWVKPPTTGQFSKLTGIKYSTKSINQKELSVFSALALLTFVWVASSLYAQLLFNSIHEALTNPLINHILITDRTYYDMLTMLKGTIYSGSFLPILAMSAWMVGYLVHKQISYKLILIPAFITYAIVMLLALTNYIPSGLKSSSPLTILPERQFLSIVFNCFRFLTVSLMLAVYGWLFSRLGYISSRLTVFTRQYSVGILSSNPTAAPQTQKQ